jgi:hypothetical protein
LTLYLRDRFPSDETDISPRHLGVLTTLAAGIFWLVASLIEVPDNQDTFIAALQRIGRINAYGAWCACVAALCAAYTFARTIDLI